MAEYICAQCWRRFKVRGLAPRTYCSRKCYDAARAAASTMDPRKLGRSRARRSFGDRPCEVCGVHSDGTRAGAIHRHHRDGDQANNDAANIAFLCGPHHDATHERLKAAGIDVDRGGGHRPRVNAMHRERAVGQATEAAALRDQGLSAGQIALRMGVNKGTVTRWFRKYPV